VLDTPPEGRIRLQQAADEWVGPRGGSDQTHAPRRVLALVELSSKERLAQDTGIELAGLGLPDNAAATSERSTCRMPPARAVGGDYAVYLAGP
jgi:hypothetical protein